MPSGIPFLLLIAAAALALGCLLGGFWALRRKRLIDDLPTSKAQGVFIGLIELRGTAETEKPLTSFLAGARCVQYSWHVEEQWSRTVVETYTDAQGHTQTRMRTESGWNRVDSGGESPPFYLKDDTGLIRIVPQQANIQGVKSFDQTVSPGNALYFGKGPATEIANSTHRRRFEETVLPLHAPLYVMGQARERQDIVAPEIAYDKNAPMFLISTRSEKQISSGYGLWSVFWLVLGLGIALGGAIAQSRLAWPTPGLEWLPYLIAAGGYALAAAVGWFWTVYNSLIGIHHRVEQGRSQVDVQLKRRHDLIPNLVSSVEGYRAYESDVQKVLAELRGQVAAAAAGKVNDFKGMAPVLSLIAERYPDLKANKSFLELQKSLVDTEGRIALARDYYNDIATFYNNRMSIIPDRFVAAVARLRPQPLITAADFERAPVNVQLST